MPTIVLGQAAGTAAALAVKTGAQPRNVDPAMLQDTLRKDDVVLDVERVEFDFEIPVDKVGRHPLRAPKDWRAKEWRH